VLTRLSAHYQRPGESLPAAAIEAICRSRSALAGLHYRRQLFLGLYDLHLHSGSEPYQYKEQDGLDAAALYRAMMKDVSGIECPSDAVPAASWYHLCMGYDAGYYGYLWSEVYAADLFAEFQHGEGGCMSPVTGRRYREAILAPGLFLWPPCPLVHSFS
jgi:Zn-dependent oligopeptidase